MGGSDGNGGFKISLDNRTIFFAYVGVFVFMCLLAMFLYWIDKRRAIAGGRRIPEAALLAVAILGGAPGALAAMFLFRHKTKPEHFYFTVVNGLFSIIIIGFFVFWALIVFGVIHL